jgi:hypothetical protein
VPICSSVKGGVGGGGGGGGSGLWNSLTRRSKALVVGVVVSTGSVV